METGTWEVYVVCPDEGTRRQVSAAGGREPVWSRTSTEIYFRSGDRMMAVEVERRPKFRAGTPRVLFEGSYRTWDPANFDVTATGRRFVRLRSVAHSRSALHLPIRLDWLDELEAKMAVAGN